MEIFNNDQCLPIIFTFLMGFSVLIYVVLDGYDLGVGMAMNFANNKERDTMIASIGPFWDANETWLVLGVGILLVAFPMAHGMILTSLYMPTAIMLIGLILRGVSLDFRAKAHANYKDRWDNCFIIGSTITAIAQGYMLGSYINGFNYGLHYILFNTLVGICLASGYIFVGSGWLIMKTTGTLQIKSVKWARASLWLTVLGIGTISVATPLLNEVIFHKWFSLPNFIFLLPIPLFTGITILYILITLKRLPLKDDALSWVPFVSSIVLFVLGFIGLAYSFYPFIVPGKMTIFEAASAHDSLIITLIGILIVLPFIIGYTAFAYKVFWGKSTKLEYY